MVESEFSIDGHLTKEARARAVQASGLVGLVQRFAGQDGVIGMHGGLPPASVFPLSSLSFTCVDPLSAARQFTADPDAPAAPASTASEGTSPTTAPPDPGSGDAEITLTIDDPAAMAAMQQYNIDFYGHPELRAWLRNLTLRIHTPAREDMEVLLAAGCNGCLDKIVRMLVENGESVLVEESMFSGPLESAILPTGCKPEVVAMDEEGVTPAGLEKAVQRSISTSGRAPKLLYIVPHCQNPTGSTMTMQRKREIYEICQQHNIVILEDDPYVCLQFPSEGKHMPGIEVDPGFLSLDTDGRVIRLDSFSKILAPGFRIAWITATPAVLKHCLSATFLPTFGAAGMSQAIAHSMLTTWGVDGFEAYLKTIQAVYQERALALARALEEECGNRVVIRFPAGGMFLWVEVPDVDDTEDLLDLMVAQKVVVVPGRYFSALSEDPAYKCKFVRMAFANRTPEELQEAACRFAVVLDAYSAKQRTCAA